ncbi:MAG: NAD-dependent epimerase/dehydratase family protein [Anaeroplasmataceae bacterium]
MKVCITGSTGMIGLALTKYLISLNHEVYMIVRENSNKLDIIPNNNLIHIVKCDLSNLSSFTPDFMVDYFIHLAWDKTIGDGRNDVYTQNLNIKYTLDAVSLAKKMGAKKFIGSGSQAEYGLKNEKLSINTLCNPITGYGIAKYAAGKMANILCEQLGLEFNWIRILSVYGEYDNPNTLVSYVKKSVSEGISPLVTPCEQIWDYIEVTEAVKIIYKIMINGSNGLTYPLGSGNARILKEYVEEFKNAINPNIEIKYGAKPYPKNQVMYLVADMSYLKKWD